MLDDFRPSSWDAKANEPEQPSVDSGSVPSVDEPFWKTPSRWVPIAGGGLVAVAAVFALTTKVVYPMVTDKQEEPAAVAAETSTSHAPMDPIEVPQAGVNSPVDMDDLLADRDRSGNSSEQPGRRVGDPIGEASSSAAPRSSEQVEPTSEEETPTEEPSPVASPLPEPDGDWTFTPDDPVVTTKPAPEDPSTPTSESPEQPTPVESESEEPGVPSTSPEQPSETSESPKPTDSPEDPTPTEEPTPTEKPEDGKTLVYTVEGKGKAEVTYIDKEGKKKSETVSLPWSKEISGVPSADGSYIKVKSEDGSKVSAEVSYDGKTVAEDSSDEGSVNVESPKGDDGKKSDDDKQKPTTTQTSDKNTSTSTPTSRATSSKVSSASARPTSTVTTSDSDAPSEPSESPSSSAPRADRQLF